MVKILASVLLIAGVLAFGAAGILFLRVAAAVPAQFAAVLTALGAVLWMGAGGALLASTSGDGNHRR